MKELRCLKIRFEDNSYVGKMDAVDHSSAGDKLYRRIIENLENYKNRSIRVMVLCDDFRTKGPGVDFP